MKVRWSPEAADDLQRICERIETDNREAPNRVARTIYGRCDQLERSFRVSVRTSRRIPGWRELVFSPLPYIAVYVVRRKKPLKQPAFFTQRAQDWP